MVRALTYRKSIIFGTLVVVLFMAIFAVTPIASEKVQIDPINVHIERVLVTQKDYEATQSLEALVAYGDAIDSTMYVMKDLRDSLENKFFHTLAIEAGNRYNVSWRLLYGIWKQESRMNPKAKGDGKKGKNGVIIPNSWRAFGLGQIHLKSAREHYDSTVTIERLMNPVENGFASAAILRDYLKTFGGSEEYGVSAYNAGPATITPYYKRRQQPPNYWNYTRNVFVYGLRANEKS